MQKYSYLGMELRISPDDSINLEYFARCEAGTFSLQACSACNLVRYPPSAGCPWCGRANYSWRAVEGKGTVYSYSEVAHAVHPGFAAHLPYMVLLVELDSQRGKPTVDEGIRVLGNLAKPDGTLASSEQVQQIGIGSRVRMVFTRLGPSMALPQWTRDEEAPSAPPWRAKM